MRLLHFPRFILMIIAITLTFGLGLIFSGCAISPDSYAGEGSRRLFMPHFSLSYPLESYSVRTVTNMPVTEGKELVQPGIVEVVPNDSLLYGINRVDQAYKISIAAAPVSSTVSTTVDLSPDLLENGLMIDYAAGLLENLVLQETKLGGVPALRVDNIPAGPVGTISQIVTIYNGLRYEVLIEQVSIATTAQRSGTALVDEILATFNFEPPTPEPSPEQSISPLN